MSIYFVAEAVTVLPWNRLSDNIMRKPVFFNWTSWHDRFHYAVRTLTLFLGPCSLSLLERCAKRGCWSLEEYHYTTHGRARHLPMFFLVAIVTGIGQIIGPGLLLVDSFRGPRIVGQASSRTLLVWIPLFLAMLGRSGIKHSPSSSLSLRILERDSRSRPIICVTASSS